MRLLALGPVLGAVLVLVLVCACGKQKESPGAEAVYVDGNACSQDVINDNNSYVMACKGITTMAEARVCKREAVRFADKYPGLNCRALKDSDKTEFSITETSVRETIKKLKDLGV